MATSLPTVYLVLGAQHTSREQLSAHLQRYMPTSQVANLSSPPILAKGLCLCCQMHNETSETLRHLFMRALRKQIPAFQHIILNCHPSIDPASIIYTLTQDFFLKERFRWGGSFLIIDRTFITNINKIDHLCLSNHFSAHIDISKISTDIPLFSAADIILYPTGTFTDDNKVRGEQLITQIYTHIQSFQPDITPPTLLPLESFNQLQLEHLQQRWRQRTHNNKRHSIFH